MYRWIGAVLGICLVVTGLAAGSDKPAALSAQSAVIKTAALVIPRFEVFNKYFGMGRLTYSDQHLIKSKISKFGETDEGEGPQVLCYIPDNKQERDFAKSAKKSGLNISIYTVAVGGKSRVRGPALVERTMKPGPSAAEIARELRNVQLHPKTKLNAFRKRGWTFFVKAVKASSQKCVSCHQAENKSFKNSLAGKRNLKIGDTIGALVVGVQQ